MKEEPNSGTNRTFPVAIFPVLLLSITPELPKSTSTLGVSLSESIFLMLSIPMTSICIK